MKKIPGHEQASLFLGGMFRRGDVGKAVTAENLRADDNPYKP